MVYTLFDFRIPWKYVVVNPKPKKTTTSHVLPKDSLKIPVSRYVVVMLLVKTDTTVAVAIRVRLMGQKSLTRKKYLSLKRLKSFKFTNLLLFKSVSSKEFLIAIKVDVYCWRIAYFDFFFWLNAGKFILKKCILQFNFKNWNFFAIGWIKHI